MQNKDGDAAFNGKEHKVDTKKHESAVNVSPSSSAQSGKQDDKTKKKVKGKSSVESFTGNRDLSAEFEDHSDNSSNDVNAAGSIVPTAGQNSSNRTNPFSAAGPSNTTASLTYGKSLFKDASQLPDNPDMLEMEDITYSDHDNVGAKADFNNLETSITVSPIPTTKTYKDHPVSQIIGDLSSTTQTRSMTRVIKDQGGLSQMFNDDFHTCMFACFLSQEEPKRVHQALKDPSWIKAMQEELFQFKMQKVSHINIIISVNPFVSTAGKNSSNSTNPFSVVGPSNTTASPTHGKYLFKNASQLPDNPDMLEMEDITYSDHDNVGAKADFNNLETSITVSPILTTKTYKDHPVSQIIGLQLKQKKDGIFISQDKYVAGILKKFGLTKEKSTSTPIDTEKPLPKDPDVKRIFRYLKGKPHLGLWYLKDSPSDLVAYSDSDYAGASLDRNSITGGCQFLGCRLISWQCKKQTVVTTSSIEAEYVAAASCYAQSNDVTRLQNLVDRKKVVITEATIRDVLRLDDADGVDCLLNEEIFAKLARIGNLLTHTTKYTSHALTQKVFANMRRVGKGFSKVEIPLFKGMLVAEEIEEQGDTKEQEALDACVALTRRVEHLEHDKVAQDLEITKLKTRVKKLERVNKERMIAELDGDTSVALIDDEGTKKKQKMLSMQEDEPKVQEAMEVVTTAKLITEVVVAVSESVTIASATIVVVPATTITAAPVRQKAKEDSYVQRYQVMKKRSQTEAQARRNVIMYLKNVVGFILDYFKGMSYDDIRPIFEAKFNSNIEFLLKSKEQVEEEENRAIKSINETPAKRRKLNEEVKDLK
nr:hypothetical protein [Tanacetum cinerariifolium]